MPWLIDGVFRQGDSEGLADLPEVDARSRPARFVHVVNPFRSSEGPSNDRVQAVSYESMRRARDFSPEIPVQLAAVVAPEHRDCVPEGFALAGILERNVTDVATFAHPTPLPLVFDILESGCAHARALADGKGENPETVYVVFTNVDIGLMPHFYAVVADIVSRGYETLTIFRRTIPPIDPDPARLASMYAEYGATHDGFDCFVFPLSQFDRYVRSDACIGRGFVMRSLLYNMVANAGQMAIVRKAHLTFHLGDDKGWKNPKFEDHNRFNVEQAKGVLVSLMQRDPATAKKLLNFCQVHKEPFRFTA
ncbi:MAG TPA: hypothetical protein VGC50_06865 [Gammaproteobacteria bacterium]